MPFAKNTESLIKTVVNPDPWTPARPRLLCSWENYRAVLTADGDVEVEVRNPDAMGFPSWHPVLREDDPADSVNLQVDPWLNTRFDPRRVFAVRFEAGGYRLLVHSDTTGYAGAGSFHARSSCRAFWFDVEAEAWVEVHKDHLSNVIVNLTYRAMCGDPAVTLTPIQRKP